MYGKVMMTDSALLPLSSDTTVDVLDVSVPDNLDVYYLRLKLSEGERILSENMYVRGVEDSSLKALRELPAAKVVVKTKFSKEDGLWRGIAEIRNDSQVPALMIRLNLKGKDGEQILPAMYSDNFFHLMPGESTLVSVSFKDEDTRGVAPMLDTTWFND